MSEQQSDHQAANNNKKASLLFASAILVILAVVVAYVMTKQGESIASSEPMPVPDVIPTKPLEPQVALVEPTTMMPEDSASVELPKPEQSESTPRLEPEQPTKPALPSLDNSDATVIQAIENKVTNSAVKLLANDDLIRRTVVFIDNLAKGDIAKKHSPVQQPKEKFTAIEGDIVTIDPNSFERYTPYVELVTRFSGAQLVRMYNEFQPLFVEAYQEIGYEGDQFEGTLESAIQELIDTPIPKAPLPLIKESVTYKYVSTEWEQLSDAQKLFLRMGPENMEKLKVTLRAVQKELKHQ
ncbi:DUF3014 domain-containing protein [Pseudoalteromonas xiamenensis]|uniref:DUF3014 domain-containing protein n=1 Tax=Pseudoalteromonas xiamenensis TaxID=882626 RepID=UPI0027E421C9|nr:DUF3014 domain-containing protein [Pseudoalteromonas xiamenensis]WMN59542.1 DUF3014 domain-containing protein [Pseudoalteromonas xiamenensis]